MTDSRDSQDNIFENATSQEEVTALLSAGPNEELRAEYQERFAATESPNERANLLAEIQLEAQKRAKDGEFASPFYDAEDTQDVSAAESSEDLAKVAEEGGFGGDIYGGAPPQGDQAEPMSAEEYEQRLAEADSPQAIERLAEEAGIAGTAK